MRDSSQTEGDFACLGNTIDDTCVLTNPPEGGSGGGRGEVENYRTKGMRGKEPGRGAIGVWLPP